MLKTRWEEDEELLLVKDAEGLAEELGDDCK
jgi:hypothetical protein